MGTNFPKKISRKIPLKELNSCVTCSLCRGYLVDATTLVECLHSFCRACILRYFENFKSACPTCNVVAKKKSNPCFRSDPILQTLVYKLVPGLYNKEVQRREDFYRSTGVRASSSCSEDSVLGDLKEEREEWMLSTNGDENQFLSPDDPISLSLEYYQVDLDTTTAPDKGRDTTKPGTINSTNQKQDSRKRRRKPNSDQKNKNALSANSSADDNNKVKLSKLCDNSSNLVKTNVGGGGGGEKKCDVKAEPGEKDGPGSKTAGDVCDANGKLKVKSETAEDVEAICKTDRRYLQCPAAVTMSHLQKFLRMKFALCTEHRVDIIHSGEVLPSDFSLMDVAYTFKWQRTKPMRFFYRLFTPAKIQPIKIINTSSVGGKQLQVVPASAQTQQPPPPPPPQPKPNNPEPQTKEVTAAKADTDAQQHYLNKERLMANLQLQSTSKLLQKGAAHHHARRSERSPTKKSSAAEEEGECIYEYEEPDKEEIRAFAEERDREWALKKQLDQEKEKYRNSKKRKKSKHSKGNVLHKKRKLHAEITSSESLQKEESLKLKVKLTPHNGYKHKHHKSSQQQLQQQQPAQVSAAGAETSPQKQPELSSKEKLLQMRQVRHKHIAMDDKSKASSSAATPKMVEEPLEKALPNLAAAKNNEEPKGSASKPETAVPKTNSCPELHIKIGEPMKKPPEATASATTVTTTATTKATPTPTPIGKPTELGSKSMAAPPPPPPKEPVTTGKTLRSDFTIKTNATKGLLMQKYPTVQLERNEQTERQAQKTFLKTFRSYTDKYAAAAAAAGQSEKGGGQVQAAAKPRPNTYPGRNPGNGGPANLQHHQQQAAKSLEQKIANLHQQCTTIEAKPVAGPKIEKRPPPQILNSHYSGSGFTVSKVEAGVKRKPENEHRQDKRPSLEITLINPPQPIDKGGQLQPEPKPAAAAASPKRPLPATIPLERIKKSMNRMSGLSIISKPPEQQRCDNSGALDLSKPSRGGLDAAPKVPETPPNRILNGLSLLSGSRVPPDNKNNMQLSNLQMLSKVALEHPNLNKNAGAAAAAPTATPNKRPQMPSLQTLKIPVPHQNAAAAPAPGSGLKSNLAKLPKLNEINKTQFRVSSNAQLRNMRPNQSQSVRDIPNPSLLVRQQNQNRLNSLSCNQGGPGENSKEQESGGGNINNNIGGKQNGGPKSGGEVAAAIVPKIEPTEVGEEKGQTVTAAAPPPPPPEKS